MPVTTETVRQHDGEFHPGISFSEREQHLSLGGFSLPSTCGPQGSEAAHFDKLRTFPPGLDNLYARMMDQISNSGDADFCKEINTRRHCDCSPTHQPSGTSYSCGDGRRHLRSRRTYRTLRLLFDSSGPDYLFHPPVSQRLSTKESHAPSISRCFQAGLPPRNGNCQSQYILKIAHRDLDSAAARYVRLTSTGVPNWRGSNAISRSTERSSFARPDTLKRHEQTAAGRL